MLELKTTLSAISGVILGTSIGCPTVLAQSTGSITTNAIAGPLLPPNEIKLTPVEQLGKFMLYDHKLDGQVLRNGSRVQLEICASAVDRQKRTLERVTRCAA
jgi:hypothetical protein